MSEERLKEIKDMIDSDYEFCRKFGIDFAIPEKELELYNEVIGLKKRNKEIYEGFLATQEEMSDYAEENEKYKSRIEKAVDFINKHCVNHKVSKEVGFKVYTMMVTDELEKVMKILENGRSDE